MTYYEQGFMSKCAEYGIDYRSLIDFMKSAEASFRRGMTVPKGGNASFRRNMAPPPRVRTVPKGGNASFMRNSGGIKPLVSPQRQRMMVGYRGNSAAFTPRTPR